MKIETLHEDSSLRVVKAGRVLFALWCAVPQLEHVHHLVRVCEYHRDSIGGAGQVMVNVIFDGIPNFSDEVRTKLAEFSKRAVSWRSAIAHVVLLTGLRGIAVRSFMSTLLLLNRAPLPSKVFDSIEAAARWLAQRLSADVEWSEARFLETFRALTPN